MTGTKNSPTAFLWVIRGLISAFLLGYLISIFLSYFVAEFYPSGNLKEDLIGVGFLLIFGFGYYLMWKGKELVAGLVFIFWYAALWPADLFIGGDTFEDSHFPGTLMLILGILLLVYRAGQKRP